MRKETNLIYRVLLIVVAVLFVVFKLEHISLPYFWDELGVYAPGALAMIDNHSIGLQPKDLEPLYSRGHPLFFVFSQAVWMKVFGQSIISAHSFSILLGIITLFITYFIGKNLWNERVGFFSTLVLAAQPIFFAMSGVVLPEMMLTIFMVLSVAAAIKKSWIWFALWATLAMMTKEFAIILPPLAFLIIGIDALLQKSLWSRKTFVQLFWASVPLIVFGLFLIIQKKQNGWYFFPLHLQLMEEGNLLSKFWWIFKDMFFRQGRWFLSLGFLASFAAIPYIKLKNRSLRPYWIMLGFIAICFLFSTLNYYLTRYMLVIIPIVALLAIRSFDILFSKAQMIKKPVWALAFISFIAVGLGILKMSPKAFNDTSDMSYRYVVELEQDAISWLEEQEWSKQKFETNFPIFQGISDVRNGYLKEKPLDFSVNFEEDTPYGIFFHLYPNENYIWKEGKQYDVIKEFTGKIGFVTVVKFK